MAVLAVAAAGALLGNAIGIGASFGWLIGSVVGTLLFPTKGPNVTQEGPRLGDLSVMSSAYGASIPIGFGTVRLSGNIIWATPIREQKTVEKTKTGGKGGGGSTVTTATYTYFASFAIAFGEGPAVDVLRIWADGKLIYDQKAGSTGLGSRPGLNFRFYKGTETQLPDSLMEADKGAGNVPGHRGLVMLVFDDLPLADFGNRIPSITAEINYETQNAEIVTTEVQSTPVPIRGNSVMVDWDRDRCYMGAQDGSAVHVFSMTTMQSVQTLPFFTIRAVNRRDGRILGTNGAQDVVVNPFSGSFETEVTNTNTERVVGNGCCASLIIDQGNFEAWITRDGETGYRAHDMSLDFLDQFSRPSSAYQNSTTVAGPVGSGLAFAAWHSADEIRVIQFQVGVDVGFFGGLSTEVNASTIFTITPEQLGGTSFSTSSQLYLAFEPATLSLVFGVIVNGRGPVLLKVNRDAGLVWDTDVPFIRINVAAEDDTRLVGRAWAYHNGSAIIRVNMATGELDDQLNGSVTFPNLGYDGTFYDDQRNAIYNFSSALAANQFRRHQLGGRAGTDVRLSEIIERLCARVGLEQVADIDTSDVRDVFVPGYVLGRQMPVRDALLPLAQVYFFDMIERDYQLVFQQRGHDAVETITEDDFVLAGQAAYKANRAQEAELPMRFIVTYMDSDNSFQQNSQYAKRIQDPDPIMYSDNQFNLTIAAALTAQFAKQAAEKGLYTAWLERNSYELRLPWTYAWLDPADAVTVQLNNGLNFRGRLASADLGVDYSIETTIVQESAGQYISTVDADGGSVTIPQIPVVGPTELFLLDTPLLRDIDATTGMSSRLYVAGSNYGEGLWPGALLYGSPEGSSWAQLVQLSSAIAWGVTENALAAPASMWRTDREGFIDVVMVNGADEIEACDELEALNGANTAMLIKQNGEVEIINFADVELLGDNKFRLRTLLRGRRGTDVMGMQHTPNERFLLLQRSDVEAVTLPLGELGVNRFYRGVTIGQLLEKAITTPFTHTGRDLMPYAPHAVTAELSDGDINLSWIRRTRVNGDLRDGTGTVPLAEETEAYEVDILDGPGGSVVRTLTSSSEAVTYTNADITSDFGDVPEELTVVVYQMSAAVGRGFGREVTLEIG